MGCAASGTFGPITRLDLGNLQERTDDLKILQENEFPYMSAKLKKVDWRAIVKEGKPWKDPDFKYGDYCLYSNH
jgi:hypothetical protein